MIREACKDCGARLEKGWSSAEKLGQCFSCYFWTEVAREYDLGQVVVIDGHAYNDHGRNGEKGEGFGGREFRYVRNGEELVTRNLWHRGVVPERFKDRLKDNAQWDPSKDMEWVDCGGTWAIGQKRKDKTDRGEEE